MRSGAASPEYAQEGVLNVRRPHDAPAHTRLVTQPDKGTEA